MDTFVPAPPEELYDVGTLLGGFDAADPLSWTTTLDARAFRGFVVSGRRQPDDPGVARERAVHDTAVTTALHRRLEHERPVAVMGGHQMERGDEGYLTVARIARGLARAGFLVLTGGGPGAMEAAHLGARLARGDDRDLLGAVGVLTHDPDARRFPLSPGTRLVSAAGEFDLDAVRRLHAWQAPAFAVAADAGAPVTESIGIPTWLYGHEPPTPLATSHAKYFANSIREDGLLAVALYGVVYAPGSAGTLQEIYQDTAQNHYRSVEGIFSPMVFLDTDGIWTASYAVDTALRRLLDPADYEAMVEFVTEPDAAVAALVQRREQVQDALAAAREAR